MSIASGAGTRIAFVPQAEFGIIPASPTFQIGRFTSSGLTSTKQSGTSDELRRDRNVPDEFLLGIDAGGALEFEFSYGAFDALIANVMCSSWAADVITNGTDVGYLTVEELLEFGVTDGFSRFRDVRMDGWTLNIAAKQAVTGSFTTMATVENSAVAPLSGATYLAAPTKPVLTASAHVAQFTVAGQTYLVSSLRLVVANNLRRRPIVGSLYSHEYGQGRFDVTVEMDVYAESNALYDNILAHNSGALSFRLGQDANEKYKFDVFNLRYSAGDKTPRRNDADVMINLRGRGQYNGNTNATLRIARAAL